MPAVGVDLLSGRDSDGGRACAGAGSGEPQPVGISALHAAAVVLDPEGDVDAAQNDRRRWVRSMARIAWACADKDCRRVGPDRRGAGSSPTPHKVVPGAFGPPGEPAPGGFGGRSSKASGGGHARSRVMLSEWLPPWPYLGEGTNLRKIVCVEPYLGRGAIWMGPGATCGNVRSVGSWGGSEAVIR